MVKELNRSYKRRLNEEDSFAILIGTRKGPKILETCDSLEHLRALYRSYLSFSKSSFYPNKAPKVIFPVSLDCKIDFNGKLEFKILRDEFVSERNKEINLPEGE